jgi:S-formylglutathione hydrolase FrmB
MGTRKRKPKTAFGAALALLPLLAFAAPAPAAELVTWQTPSRHVDPAAQQFNSPPPGADPRPNALRVSVLLPDGYDGRRRFPVLYLLHGHGDAYDYWANPERGALLEVARGFPGIVVMPEGARGWYANWWNGGARRAPAWERYHLDELVPLVERRLKVRRARRWHAIAGLSMGGEGAIFYATQRPGYFGSAASFSGVLSLQRPHWPQAFDTQGENHQDVFGDPQAQRFYWTGHNPTALVENLRHTRVYATVGDGTPGSPDESRNVVGALAEAELRGHADDFAAAARGAGVDLTYEPRQGIHDWPYWREHLAAALRWGFFEPVRPRTSTWSYSTVARRSEAWGLRFRFAQPPEELITFSRNRYRLKGTGAGSARVRMPNGRRLTLALPFERKLPRKSWRARR